MLQTATALISYAALHIRNNAVRRLDWFGFDWIALHCNGLDWIGLGWGMGLRRSILIIIIMHTASKAVIALIIIDFLLSLTLNGFHVCECEPVSVGRPTHIISASV